MALVIAFYSEPCMWVSEAPGGIRQVFAFHLCVPSAGCWRTSGRDTRRVIQSRCGFFVQREGRIWKMALGQELQDVMGTDPWRRLLSRSKQSSAGLPRGRGTHSRTLAVGILILDASLGHSLARCLLQPGEAGPAGDAEQALPAGCCWVSWLSSPSPCQLQGHIPPH